MVAAILFAVSIALLCLFQLALALGAPWGRLAWGGQHPGRLPAGYRIGSGIAILVYAGFAALALDRGGVLDLVPDTVSLIGMWVVVGVLVLGILMNLLSRSKLERYLMTPVALVLAVLAFLVALLGVGGGAGPGGPGTGSHAGNGEEHGLDYRFAVATVLDAGDGPVLCAGGVREPFPPQCDGPRVLDWDWAAHEHQEAGGVRWGEYDLVVAQLGDRVRVSVRSTDDGDGLAPSVAWAEPGRSFELITYGSSSCPWQVTGAETVGSDAVLVRLRASGGEICTADLAPARHEVDLPQEVTGRPVAILLGFEGAEVPGVLALD